MATNLVEQIANTLGPVIVGRIASSLGFNETATQKAIVAAIPALLAALISYISKPQGASKLNDVVRKQEPGVLSSIANVIGGSGQKALIDQGSSVLTSLLGKRILSGLSSAVGQYAGIGESGSKSLMGLLGPVVLGVLGHEQRDRGLDASGLANLLTSQKDTVQAALPSGFSRYLSQAGILDDLTGAATTAVSRTPERSASSSWSWWLWALALLAIGIIAWRLLSTPEQVAETSSPPSDALVEGTDYHATGNIPCAMGSGQPTGSCPFGVKREGNGSGIVTVTKPDSRTRTIFFKDGKATGAETSEADPGDFTVEKQNDLSIVRIGDERYEIPDAVIFGG